MINYSHLPTAEEYKEHSQSSFRKMQTYSDPKYQCPKCGGGMCRNEMIVLTSYPVQYEYSCNKCGHVDYQFN